MSIAISFYFLEYISLVERHTVSMSSLQYSIGYCQFVVIVTLSFKHQSTHSSSTICKCYIEASVDSVTTFCRQNRVRIRIARSFMKYDLFSLELYSLFFLSLSALSLPLSLSFFSSLSFSLPFSCPSSLSLYLVYILLDFFFLFTVIYKLFLF